jgi:hypothetical protein
MTQQEIINRCKTGETVETDGYCYVCKFLMNPWPVGYSIQRVDLETLNQSDMESIDTIEWETVLEIMDQEEADKLWWAICASEKKA